MFESTAEKTEKKVNVKDMTVIALVTAVICIIAPFSIPIAISPIPITLALFALFLAGIILGKWKGVVCTVIYLLLGMVGLPVFNGFSGGVQKLVGPTGGYLIGYLFLVFFTGLFVEKFPNKIPMYFVGGIIGIIVCYAFGTVWFVLQYKVGFLEALCISIYSYGFSEVSSGGHYRFTGAKDPDPSESDLINILKKIT